MTSAAPPSQPALGVAGRHALDVAAAAVLCFLVVEWLNLAHANLAVWTTFMVMAQYTFTVFQKGIERILGRALGILAGWMLVAATPDAWLVRHFVETVLLAAFFYVYFANRLAYTFLNAGLYLAVIVEIGLREPDQVLAQGKSMFLAIVVGVAAADLVIWLTGHERDLRFQTAGEALLPLRPDWLNHGLILVASVLLVVALTRWLGLPTEQAVISVFLLSVSPHVQASLRKGELRLVGAALAVAWAAATFQLVSLVPHLLVLAGMLFFGTLLAAYLTRTGEADAYAGVQMGLVLPLLIVVPPAEVGDLTAAWQRIEGIVAALVSTLLVGSLWPFFPLAQPAAPTAPLTPAPSPPGGEGRPG